MSFVPFLEKYGGLHAKIQQDVELVKGIYRFAEDRKDEKGYHPTGLRFEEIPLGLMVKRYDFSYTQRFASMHLLYDLTEGKIDLSKLFLFLDNKLGFVSEDMSQNGRLTVEERCDYANLPEIIRTVYGGNSEVGKRGEIERTTFAVRDGREIVRTPVVDVEQMPITKFVDMLMDRALRFNEYFPEFPNEFKLNRV